MTAWVAAMSHLPHVVATSTLGALRVDSDRATGRAYPRELVVRADGSVRVDTGRYDDEYVKRGGRWLFKSRIYTGLHSG